MKSKTTGLTRRGLLGTAALATAGVLVGAGQARAEWPERTVKIIVNFPPGGGADTTARTIQPLLQQALGQPVIIENRGGAAGNIGISAASKAEPDGYTILLTSSVFTSNPATAKQNFYDPIKDFEPIISFGGSPNLIAANPKLGINNLKDLIAYAKANPGKLNYSTPGVGTPSQLGIELLTLQTGAKFQHVPYPGGGPAVQAAVAGDVQLTVVNIASLISLVRGGQLVGVVQTGPKRWHELSDVGTQQEAGVTGADYDVYYSILVPSGVPKPIGARLAKELDAIAKRPDVRERLLKVGVDVTTGGDAEFLRAKIAREVKMWKDVVQKANIKVN
jgi:tripartite-type tricarboxylate transporter receptor subunit TctC